MNVNGVNEPVKRGKVLSYLRALQADVIFLQETHLKMILAVSVDVDG